MMTITFSTGLGLSFNVQPNDQSQLTDTIEHNPEARYLAPILGSALDVLREMKADQDGFADFLRHIVSACDADPDARVSVTRTQQEQLDHEFRAAPLQVEGKVSMPPAPTAGYLPVVVGPGDLLVISMPDGTTYAHLDEIKAEFDRVYPGVRVAVIRGAQQLAVVKNGGLLQEALNGWESSNETIHDTRGMTGDSDPAGDRIDAIRKMTGL